jgi:predicted transcriptional regulator
MVKKKIEKSILDLIKRISPRPISTRELSTKLKIAWHTADRYCLKLKLKNKIDAYTIGKATAWYLTK